MYYSRLPNKTYNSIFHDFPFKKLVGTITLLFFCVTLCTEFSFALKTPIQTSAIFNIPSQIGTIVDEYKGAGNKHVMVIQDLHCNPVAQRNISEIIQKIRKTYPKSNTISIEGSSGIIDTSFLRNIPKNKSKQTLFAYLINNGYIGGGELYSIQNKDTVLYGIEDETIYTEDFKLLYQSFSHREKTGAIFKKLRKLLKQEKKIFYSDKLKKFEKQKRKYEKGKIGFEAYIEKLIHCWTGSLTPSAHSFPKNEGTGVTNSVQQRDLSSSFLQSKNGSMVSGLQSPVSLRYPELHKKLTLTKTLKKINKKQVMWETRTVVKLISNNLTKKEKEILNDKSPLSPLNKGGSSMDYYLYLKKLLDSKNIAIERNYTELAKYLNSITQLQKIDMLKILLEQKKLETDAALHLAKNTTEKLLVETDYYLDSFEAFLNNRASSKEVEQLKSNKTKLEKLLDRLLIRMYGNSSYAEKKQVFEKAEKTMDEFYDLAVKRNEIMVGNMIKQILKTGDHRPETTDPRWTGFATPSTRSFLKNKATENADGSENVGLHQVTNPVQQQVSFPVSTMIIGGFHTVGITEILRSKGIGYTVIMPNIVGANSRSPLQSDLYISRVKQQAKWMGLKNTETEKKPQTNAQTIALKALSANTGNINNIIAELRKQYKVLAEQKIQNSEIQKYFEAAGITKNEITKWEIIVSDEKTAAEKILAYAVAGNRDIVIWALESNLVDVSATDKNGKNIFHIAAAQGDEEKNVKNAQMLLDIWKQKTHDRKKEKQTLNGGSETIENPLLMQDAFGLRPVDIAAVDSQKKIVEMFFNKMEQKDKNDALSLALFRKHLDAVKLFLKMGLKIREKQKKIQFLKDLLHDAAKKGNTDFVISLLEQGIMPDEKTRPLLISILSNKHDYRERPHLVKLFLKAGLKYADQKKIPYFINILFRRAANRENIEFVKLFLNAGVMPDEKIKRLLTPILLKAAEQKSINTQFVKLLLNAGVMPDEETRPLLTPMHLKAIPQIPHHHPQVY